MAEPLCTDMTVTDGLQGRMLVMFDRADAIVARPGELGPLDELVKVASWRHHKAARKARAGDW